MREKPMIVRRPRVPQGGDGTLASLGRVTQRDVMARGLRSNPRDMSTPRPRRSQRPRVSRLLCTTPVGSHGSGGALPLQWWAAPFVPCYQGTRPGKLARHHGHVPLVPSAVVEHKPADSCGW